MSEVGEDLIQAMREALAHAKREAGAVNPHKFNSQRSKAGPRMEYHQKLAFLAEGFASALTNPSLHRIVDGEKCVVLTYAEAETWMDTLNEIIRALGALNDSQPGRDRS